MDCAFVDNEMPYGRVPQGHPVIVDYFYYEEIRWTENTGKRNRLNFQFVDETLNMHTKLNIKKRKSVWKTCTIITQNF